MAASRVGSTNPELLRRVAALWDNPAWGEFFGRYDAFVRTRCSIYGLESASVDDPCQRVWVELAQRMPSYRYDPCGSFRGWLRRLCHHRAIDLLRQGRDQRFEPLDGEELIDGRCQDKDMDGDTDDDEAASHGSGCCAEALAIQEDVRQKVKPVRWEAFCRVAIEGEPVSVAAAALGLKYATVYAGVNHVAELLRAEGRRREARLGPDDSLSPAKG